MGNLLSNKKKCIIMEAENILSADVLDIIFDDRNKEYGAYDLRKHYQQRLTKSLMVTFLLVVLICLTYILLGSMKPNVDKLIVGPDVTLEKAPPQEKKIEVIPPLQKIEPPQIKMIRDMVPLIVKGEVPKDEEVPEQTEITDAKIGNANTEGTAETGIVAPVEERTSVVDAPKKQEADGGIFEIVEIESQYPGGVAAWSKFLYRNLTFPQEAIDINVQGTVTIQFIVDTEGNVSDVTAISGPEELRPAAVSVIRKSGKWTAAIQNGRKVKSYKKQPITFKLAPDQ
jgi:protein TonB